MLRWFLELATAFSWIAAALAFSAVSIAAVLGLTWLMRLAFPFLPDFVGIFALLLSLVIYVAAVSWIGWKILKRRLRP